MHSARRTASVLSLVVCLTVGCQSGAGDATKGAVRSDGFPAPSQYSVWQTAHQVFRDQQLTVDEEASSAQSGLLVSRWRASLSPFSREGYRDKATVRIFPVEGRPGYFRTETNVVRQINADMRDPGNPMAADWSADTRHLEMESLLNRRIEMFFLPSEVSDTFRRHHGMEPGSSPRIEEPAAVEPPPSDNPFDFLAPR